MRFDELMEYAKEEGMRRGIEEGIEKGMQQGLEQGLEQGMKQERQQTLFELLEMQGTVSEELRALLESEHDVEKLRKWCRLAAKVQSVAEFMDKM